MLDYATDISILEFLPLYARTPPSCPSELSRCVAYAMQAGQCNVTGSQSEGTQRKRLQAGESCPLWTIGIKGYDLD